MLPLTIVSAGIDDDDPCEMEEQELAEADRRVEEAITAALPSYGGTESDTLRIFVRLQEFRDAQDRLDTCLLVSAVS